MTMKRLIFGVAAILCLAIATSTCPATSIFVIVRPEVIVFAADGLGVAPGPHGKRSYSCKLFSSGHTILALSGLSSATGGRNPFHTADDFLSSAVFAGSYDEQSFKQAADRFAADYIAHVALLERTRLRGYGPLIGNLDAVLAGFTSSGRLVMVSERIWVDKKLAPRAPYLVAIGTLYPTAISAHLTTGSGATPTEDELTAQLTFRAQEQQPLLGAIASAQTLTDLRDTSVNFISLSESWFPQFAGGNIAVVHLTPQGVIWDRPCQ